MFAVQPCRPPGAGSGQAPFARPPVGRGGGGGWLSAEASGHQDGKARSLPGRAPVGAGGPRSPEGPHHLCFPFPQPPCSRGAPPAPPSARRFPGPELVPTCPGVALRDSPNGAEVPSDGAGGGEARGPLAPATAGGSPRGPDTARLSTAFPGRATSAPATGPPALLLLRAEPENTPQASQATARRVRFLNFIIK